MSFDTQALKQLAQQFRNDAVSTPVFVSDVLREAIISGVLSAHSLIRQDSVADVLVVSKIPVREALRTLEGENLVQFERNRGARVLPGSIEEMTEIFELRKVLEPHLLRQSIPNLTPQNTAEALALVEQEAASTNPEELGQLNRRFHEILLSGANDTLGYRFLSILYNASERYLRLHRRESESRSRSNVEHRKLTEACLARDGSLASELLLQHLEAARQVIHGKLVADQPRL
ncbi:GntR family transcriptional regulator [Kiloniella laminariae]|uniref:GntR family transcriptional regulator n=1 Tax=Kiloniella laminariae TaxID=454162 RepID=A0ABT4LPI1_9PROT|nr:GntR family transcriptional regulator [Kiloniella laminariae]MCZ4283042.1 GntR family transcriptional regulator [Kiloniella laminariae]